MRVEGTPNIIDLLLHCTPPRAETQVSVSTAGSQDTSPVAAEAPHHHISPDKWNHTARQKGQFQPLDMKEHSQPRGMNAQPRPQDMKGNTIPYH